MADATKLVNLLASKDDIIPKKVLDSLRTQIKQAQLTGKPVTAEQIASILVKKEFLTPRQAKNFLEQLTEPAGDDDSIDLLADLEEVSTPSKKTLEEEDEELMLAPIEEDERHKHQEKKKVASEPQHSGTHSKKAAQTDQTVQNQPAPKKTSTPAVKSQDRKRDEVSGTQPQHRQKKAAEKPSSDKNKVNRQPKSTTPSLLDEELGLDTSSTLSPLDTIPDEEGGATPLLLSVPKKKGFFTKIMQTLGLKKKNAPAAGSRSGKKKAQAAQENPWDSKLMLLGGGALLLMIILGGALLWNLLRKSADELFYLAEDDYKKASFTQAIEKYNTFLERYPKDTNSSLARVHLGLAHMRRSVDGSRDWSKTLSDVKLRISEISSESSFGEARPELRAMLPKVAEGLAKNALETLEKEKIAEAEEAISLILKYAIKNNDDTSKLNDIRAITQQAIRNASRDEELQKTVILVDELLTNQDPIQAYQACSSLTQRYPDAAADERLLAARQKIALTEQSMIRFIEEKTPPIPQENSEQKSIAAIILAQKHNAVQNASNNDNNRTFFNVEGTLYALDSSTGNVLWHQKTGSAVNTRTPQWAPSQIAKSANAGVLTVNYSRKSLILRNGNTGNVIWEQNVSAPIISWPLIAGNEIIQGVDSGRIYAINASTGEREGYFQLLRRTRIRPAYDPATGLIYQPAEHSNLFVLSRSQKISTAVYDVGHQSGEILISPAIVSSLLVVPVNIPEGTMLKVYPLNAETTPANAMTAGSPVTEAPASNTVGKTSASDIKSLTVKPIQIIRLPGHASAEIQVLGNRILTATDAGIYILGITDNPQEPLKKEAEQVAVNTSDNNSYSSSFLTLRNTEVYLADSQLTRLDIQTTRNRLQRRWNVNGNSASLQPLDKGNVHIRKELGKAGITASEINLETGASIWNTQLAVSLCTAPVVTKTGEIIAFSQLGAIYELKSSDLKDGTILNTPTLAAPDAYIPKRAVQGLCTPEGVILLVPAEGSRSILACNRGKGKALKFESNTVPDAISGNLVPYRSTVLVPTVTGYIYLMDQLKDIKRAEPFQPKLNGENYFWYISESLTGGAKWLAANDKGEIFQLTLTPAPNEGEQPTLQAAVSVKLESPVQSPLAILNTETSQIAFFVDQNNVLQRIDTSSLKVLTAEGEGKLQEPLRAGPWVKGNVVIYETADGILHAVDAMGKTVWSVNIPLSETTNENISSTPEVATLAGEPLFNDGKIIITTVSGIVSEIHHATGKAEKQINTGYHLVTGASALDNTYLIGTSDGCIIRVGL